MDSSIWGPHAWFFLHTVTFNYPNNPTPIEKAQYYNFFMNLQHILPCELCKKNYPKHIKDYPLKDDALKNKKSLTKWLVNVHNETNRDLGKKVVSYKKVLKLYNSIYNSNPFKMVIIYICILIALVFFLRKK